MPFNSSQEAENRLGNPAPLTSDEIRDLFPWMNQVGQTAMRRLELQNLRALQNFEQSSSTLTKWLIGLTVVLVVLTIVIARYTVVLARKEPSAGEHQSTSQVSAKKTLGPWKAKFTIPGSEQSMFISFGLRRYCFRKGQFVQHFQYSHNGLQQRFAD